MSAPDSYPQAVYKDGHDFEWDGRSVSHKHVHSAEEYEAALADGWQLPYDFLAAPKAPKTLLDGNAETIKAALPGKTGDELLELLEAEQKGKTRKGVIAALEEAIEKLIA